MGAEKMLESMMRGLPENIKYHLTHIGIVNGEQDYLNKKFILGKMCFESNACRVFTFRALKHIRDYMGK